MKHLIALVIATFLIGSTLNAQGKGKITIRKNINGVETIEEHEFDINEDNNLEDILDAEGLDLNIDLDIDEYDGAQIMEIIIDENEQKNTSKFKSCKPHSRSFLGVKSDYSYDGEGAKVGTVIEGSSAEKMGIKEGDIITKFNGEEIESFSDLVQAVNEVEAGEKVEVRVNRDGSNKRLNGEMGKREGDEYSFHWHGDDEDYHFEFGEAEIEHMLKGLENMGDIDIDIEMDEQDMEAWAEELKESMESWSEDFSESFNSDMHRRTVVVILQDISDEDLEAVNESAEPKLRANNDLDLEELRFFPNPGDGNFELQFYTPESADLSLMIFDSQGKKVYYEMLGDFSGKYENRIDISRRPAGNYFLQVEQGGKTYSKKIVKE